MTTILLIDDHIELLDIIEDIFIREGFQVLKASSAGEAIRAALDHLPDVILCDLFLPDYSGRDVRGALCQCVETARIPFGLMTVNALVKPEEGEQWLFKPFSIKDILAMVSELLTNASLAFPRPKNDKH